MKPASVHVLESAAASFEAIRDLIEWSDQIEFAYAWMSSDLGQSELWRLLDDRKVSRGIVGTSFAGTEPGVFDYFHTEIRGSVRYAPDAPGTFHPKLIVGSCGRRRRAVLGSSNFTTRGFGGNVELNVLLHGTAEQSEFLALRRVIDEYWRAARPITGSFLAGYHATWERQEAQRRRARGLNSRRVRATPRFSIDALDISWAAYSSRILAREREGWLRVRPRHDGAPSYLSETQAAREAFEDYGSFADMPPDLARFVAGFGPNAGWYGATRANGGFMHLVKARPDLIAELIDPVPREGPVSDDIVVEVFERAEALPRVRIACTTRLLCIKRPDQFYPVNSANQQGMCKSFGRAPSTAEEYLELLELIRSLPWYRSPEPRDPLQAELWRSRVALLDVVFYRPRD